ncbi:MAG: formate dehydrogenase accessory sulfurtransferase FdhD [Deltaproteobacteria bacterium]|nr:formate dehydrogenase accessory sulfurtransferase FdhD [Deltaproteobacteria bacterium]
MLKVRGESSQQGLPQRSEDLEGIVSIPTAVYDRSGSREERSQLLVREQPVTLYLNGREVVTLVCAGHHLDELAAGFFHAEGFLRSPEDLEELRVDASGERVEVRTRKEPLIAQQLWSKRTVTSGCGKGSAFYHALDALLSKPCRSTLRMSPGQVLDRVEDLNRLSETYRRTHGVHNTALATADELLLFRDDIGRHNAADMVVGHVFLRGIPLEDKVLVTTGRLTSEILLKAARVGFPILASRNASTSLAVELAVKLNITLIGYARAGRFTVYSGEERILD